MKRQHSGYILAALVLSVCSHVVHIVSEMSQSWVVAETVPSDGENVTISYGLYQGFMEEKSGNLTENNLILTITCLLYLNVCAWTCQSGDSLRREEVLTLYISGQLLYPCANKTLHHSPPVAWVRERFIDGVVWLATVVAVVLSGLVSLVALILTAYNVNHTPSSSWLSIRGLYFWFGTSFTPAVELATGQDIPCEVYVYHWQLVKLKGILSFLALVTWGIEFFLKLARNVGTVDTIAGLLSSNEKAHLGYSYWLQLVVVGLHCCCLALLHYRETLFDQRPPFIGSLRRQNNTLNYTNYL